MTLSRENVHLLRPGDVISAKGYPAKVLRVLDGEVEVEYLDDEQKETVHWSEIDDVIRLVMNDGKNSLQAETGIPVDE